MIEVPVTVFAKFWRNRRAAPLKQVKYSAKKENQIPFKYYRTAIATIIRYHRNGNDPAVFRKKRIELGKKLATCEKPGKAIILRNNLRAIDNYETFFAKRKFEVRPVPHLRIQAAGVSVSSKFDMHVREDGKPRLIKLNLCRTKMNEQDARATLAITGEAARRERMGLRSSEIVMFMLEDGTELRGEDFGVPQSELDAVGYEFEEAWNSI